MTISEATEAPSEAANLIPLSHTQEFLRMFDQGDAGGPFGPRYNLVVGWRITGSIDLDTFRLAVNDVVARHDSLRATIVRGDGVGHQVINPPTDAIVDVRQLTTDAGDRDRVAEEFLIEVEEGSYDVAELPHVRVVLGRFDDEDTVLALVAHHTASDGWSMQLMARDIAACYAVRRGYAECAPPPARSYEEYARWQRDSSTSDEQFARDYWREKLRDARILAIPTDHARSANRERLTSVYRFSIPADLTADTVEFARTMRSSPFMVLLAAYNVLLHGMTGATDLVVPTLTSGRNEPQFEDTVGPFFNFVPLRTRIEDCANFRQVLERTRSTCVEAYSYHLPFPQIMGEAPEVMAPMLEDNLAACAFQVWQFSTVMDGSPVGDLRIAEVRKRLLFQRDGTDIPDGALLTLDVDPTGEMYGNLSYNTNLYDKATMVKLVADFQRVLRNAVTTPDAPLGDL